MSEADMAFEFGITDDAQRIYRLVRWSASHFRGPRLRMTNYFADHELLAAKLERVDPDDVILIQEFLRAPAGE